MDFDTGRRGFLQLTGVGTAASVAGCNALPNAAQSEATPEQDTATDATAMTVTVAIEADQEKLTERRKEIQSELQNGNISRREAQQQYQKVQTKLRKEAATAFATRVESNGDLRIEDDVAKYGVFLVTGPAPSLIESLSFGEVSALLAKDVFQQAKSQAASPTPTSN